MGTKQLLTDPWAYVCNTLHVEILFQADVLA